MTENPISSSTSLPETSGGPAADNLRRQLEIGFLCAPNDEARQKALIFLEKDRLRAVMAGMTPEQREFWAGVDSVPWDKVKEGGQAAAEVFLPALIGFEVAEYLSPEAGKNLAVAAMAGSVTMEALALGVYKAEKVAQKHPRAAVLAQALTVSRLLLSHGGTALGSFGLGLGGAEIRDAIGRLQGIEQIASPVSAGGGEGLSVDHPMPVGGSIDQVGGLSLDARDEIAAGGQAPAGQPIPEAAPGNVLPHPGGQIPAEDLLPQPGDAEALVAAEKNKDILETSTPVSVAGQDLAGGTVLGHELEFVKGLGDISHVEPTANMLKNFDAMLAQPQTFAEIGPDDKAQLMNRELAPWLARQLDGVIGGDPSTFDQNRKLLWDIGVSGRRATQEEFGQIVRWFVENMNKYK